MWCSHWTARLVSDADRDLDYVSLPFLYFLFGERDRDRDRLSVLLCDLLCMCKCLPFFLLFFLSPDESESVESSYFFIDSVLFWVCWMPGW